MNPDRFLNCGHTDAFLCRLAGNSMTVPVIAAILKRMAHVMGVYAYPPSSYFPPHVTEIKTAMCGPTSLQQSNPGSPMIAAWNRSKI